MPTTAPPDKPAHRLRIDYDRRAGDQQAYQDYLVRCLGPSVHALTVLAVIGGIVIALASAAVGQAPSVPPLLQLLPLLALMPIVIATQEVRSPLWLRVLSLTCIGLLQFGLNLQGMGSTAELPWIWPATLLVPVASALIWLRKLDFTLGMALCAFGPTPMLWLNGTSGNAWLQYGVYMALTMALCVVLRTFMSKTLIEQFRLERQLRERATTDDLSGFLSRNRFLELATDAIEAVRAQRKPTSLLYIDVDHFKSINDDYGHAAGDAALVALAAALRAQMRQSDIIGRVGGEEFAVLLSGTGLRLAAACAERMREAAHGVARPDGNLSVSIGVAECPIGADCSIETLLARADLAMRQAKHDGRDRVVTATD